MIHRQTALLAYEQLMDLFEEVLDEAGFDIPLMYKNSGILYVYFLKKDCEHYNEIMTMFLNEKYPSPTEDLYLYELDYADECDYVATQMELIEFGKQKMFDIIDHIAFVDKINAQLNSWQKGEALCKAMEEEKPSKSKKSKEQSKKSKKKSGRNQNNKSR